MVEVEIDKNSGFCFGVVNAIECAEKELRESDTLYCLGDIVHNSSEVERLQNKGLITIDHQELPQLKGVKLLLRAHGEPPSTYAMAKQQEIELIDATCPVVLKLQQKIKQSYRECTDTQTQIVIYGQKGHAEVNGLVGQTNGEAVVIEGVEQLDILDYSRPIKLYAQTTKPVDGFKNIVAQIKQRLHSNYTFEYYDTICRQVANRLPNIRTFASRHPLILFVSGKKSSNGKVLYQECCKVNSQTHFISTPEEMDPVWFQNVSSVGICGATSTPKWLMEQVFDRVKTIIGVKTT